MAKFKVGDRVVAVERLKEYNTATVAEVNSSGEIRVRWDNSSIIGSIIGSFFWPASDFELINPATKEPEMKYTEILEPREPVKAYQPKVGVYRLSNASELEVFAVSESEIDLAFTTSNDCFGWTMIKPDIAELIEVLKALHDAMND